MISPKARLLAGTLAASLIAATPALAAADLSVGLDQTRTLRIEQPIQTLSIGNPAIADVNVRDGQTIFVLGKSYGRTNVLGLDAKGETVLDMTVSVTASDQGAVTVYRGSKQTSYDCAKGCQRALVPGDDKDQFELLQSQISSKVHMGTSGGN